MDRETADREAVQAWERFLKAYAPSHVAPATPDGSPATVLECLSMAMSMVMKEACGQFLGPQGAVIGLCMMMDGLRQAHAACHGTELEGDRDHVAISALNASCEVMEKFLGLRNTLQNGSIKDAEAAIAEMEPGGFKFNLKVQRTPRPQEH